MPKTFKFGQLLEKEDICNRQKEIRLVKSLCHEKGRAVIYGPRRYGKTSLVKNIVLKDFSTNKKSLGIYADLFQLESEGDLVQRLKVGFDYSLGQKAKVKIWLTTLQNYLKNFYLDISFDPLSGVPSFSLRGSHHDKSLVLQELFQAIKQVSRNFSILLVLDEFQDIQKIKSLEAKLRNEIQNLTNIPVILMGSKKHILQSMFNDESKPFYGFGTDIEFGPIPRQEWFPYMQERFEPLGLSIKIEEVDEICQLMHDVPNAIQELCQWIALSGVRGVLDKKDIHLYLVNLVESKSSRYLERLASFTQKEKFFLAALSKNQPLVSPTSTNFIKLTGVSATATRAIIERLVDRGVLQLLEDGFWITDPLFSLYLQRQ